MTSILPTVTDPAAAPSTSDSDLSSAGRPAARVNPPSGPTFGDVVSATSRPTSKVEESVKAVLREAGFRVAKGPMGVVCHHPDKDKAALTLTPDIVLGDLWLAIEVDPCGPVGSSRGYTHAGEEGRRTVSATTSSKPSAGPSSGCGWEPTKQATSGSGTWSSNRAGSPRQRR